MTYQEVLAALQAANPVTQSGGSWQDGMWVPSTTTTPGAYMLPGGGFVQQGMGGSLATYVPAGDQGVQYTTYGPDGQIGEQGYQKGQSWQQGALTGLGVLGGAAALGNLPALLAGGAASGGAVAPAATSAGTAATATGSVAPALTTEGILGSNYALTGNTALSGLGSGATFGAPGIGAAGAAGALAPIASTLTNGADGGGTDWMKLLQNGGSAANSLLSNPALWAAGGAALGLAGRGDITSSQTANGSSSQQSAGANLGYSNGQTSQGIAPWMMPYAQQLLGNASSLANGPMSNTTLDQARGLLTGAASDPTVAAGRQQQQDVIAGKYLNSNPYIDQVAQNIGQRMGDAYATGTRAGIFSGFNNDGNSVASKSAFGQSLGMADRNYADALGSTMSNLYYGNFNNERNAQNAAAQGAINFGNYGLNAGTTLGNFGQADWLRPFQANQFLGQAINPAFGSQGTSTQNTSSNFTNATNGQTNNTVNSTVAGPNAALAGMGGGLAGLGLWQNIFNTKA